MLTTTLRLSLVLAIAAVLTLAGVSRPRVADAQATTTTSNETFPFTGTFEVPCANGGAGELVEVTGEIHFLTHSTLNDNHGTSKIHSNRVLMTGVGQTTGDLYRFVGASDGTFISQSDGTLTEVTSAGTTHLVASGPDNNFLGRQLFHFTFNHNGELTSFRFEFTSDCN
jgi:hypothetical protein